MAASVSSGGLAQFSIHVIFHGDNTGSNPVGDANKESAIYDWFRRNFVGTKRHNLYQALGLLHRPKFRPRSRPGLCRGCAPVSSPDTFWTNTAYQAGNPALRCPLVFGDGLRIGIEGDATGRMPEQLLGDFDVRAACPSFAALYFV
jgi:hypothetical protein